MSSLALLFVFTVVRYHNKSAIWITAVFALCVSVVCHVALNRPSYQSSVYFEDMPDGHYRYPAHLANDGSKIATYRTGTTPNCAITLQETHPWWAVDLGVPLSVQEIFLTNRDSSRESVLYTVYSLKSTWFVTSRLETTRVEPVKLVVSSVSNRVVRQARHSQNALARHVERVVSRRDVTSQMQFGLIYRDCGTILGEVVNRILGDQRLLILRVTGSGTVYRR